MGSNQPPSIEPSVLAGLRSRDAASLEACYRDFGPAVYRVCRSMLGQDSDAQDATQEVFMKVYLRAQQFAGKSSFSTWLHRIAVNHCLQRIEKEARRRAQRLDADCQDGALVDPSPTPLEQSASSEGQQRIDALLARLPAKQRAVVVLREVEGLSYAAIAEVLEIAEGTVMSRLSRGRERLASLLIRPEEKRSSRCAS